MIGENLLHYEIIGHLGKGGMGVVYRARDTRLDREVALKLLPDDVVDDPERTARFEREARLLASLNHPLIAQIHGLEADGATKALVMELVEGPTLADRLRNGPLPLDEALGIALRIAQALEEAHGHGIVHRDLKPQNVKASDDGKVKVLDFGLAKALGPTSTSGSEASPSELEASPTLSLDATQRGVILGTAAYMSPEQAKAAEIDTRADVWAFGVVLWEMLVGRRLFDAPTVPETLALVLTREPDPEALPTGTPTGIRRLLRRCLARDPERRLHSIADARLEIEEVLDGGPHVETTTSADGAGRSTPAVARIAGAVLLLGAALAIGLQIGRGTSAPAVPTAAPMRLVIQLEPELQLLPRADGVLRFTPDGRSLLFGGLQDGRRLLFRRELADGSVRPIEGTDDSQSIFFSPDGEWLGFVSGGKLRKVPLAGGRPIDIAETRGAGGAIWLPDGSIVFAPLYSDGLFRMDAAGNNRERLTTPDHEGGVLGHWHPILLPDGRSVLFTAFRTPVDRSRIGLLDLETSEIRWIVDGGFYARWVDTGHILFARGLRVFALPFDLETATAIGPEVPILDDVRTERGAAVSSFAVSSRGSLAWISDSRGAPPRDPVWIDRSGDTVSLDLPPHRFLNLAISPNGERVALAIEGDSRDLWSVSLARGTLSRLTDDPTTEYQPAWTPDGRELVYVVDEPPFQLYRRPAGSTGPGRPIWDDAARLDTHSPTLSPDGHWVAFTMIEPETGANLWVRQVDESEPGRAFRASRAEEVWPAFSPTGRWLAYQSNETGRDEIYVEAFPGPGERIQLSADGGRNPLWSRNGEIFYRNRLETRAVLVTEDGDGLEIGTTRALFSASLVSGEGATGRTWDVTADGERLLALVVPEDRVPRRIEVVTDWTSRLHELAPADSR